MKPGEYLQSIEPIELHDREYTRRFKEVVTETGYIMGRAEVVQYHDGEEWVAFCLFAGYGNSDNRIHPEGDYAFPSWEAARDAILTECDRREREAQERHAKLRAVTP